MFFPVLIYSIILLATLYLFVLMASVDHLFFLNGRFLDFSKDQHVGKFSCSRVAAFTLAICLIKQF